MSESDSGKKEDTIFLRNAKRRCIELRKRTEDEASANDDDQQIRSESDSGKKEDTIFIRKPKKRCIALRKRTEDEASHGDDDEQLGSKLIDMRAAQKLRNKCNGVDLLVLNGLTSVEVQSSNKDDRYNLKKGGLIHMPALKNRNATLETDFDDTGIGAKFSTETNKRDEDDEMMKYIDEQMKNHVHKHNLDLAARCGFGQIKSDDEDPLKQNLLLDKDYSSFEDAALHSVSNNMIGTTQDTTEEMLSNQMLNGIPEIDLGIETKIKNIEATEDAKVRLMLERQRKKDSPSQFVPTNMAVNFVQHNRFSMEESGLSINEEKNQLLRKRGIYIRGGKFDLNQNATDDYHYEKFKRQFRRY